MSSWLPSRSFTAAITLPISFTQLSDDDAMAAIKAIVVELGAESLKDMGKVMAAVKDRLGSQLDMSKASGWVKAALS